MLKLPHGKNYRNDNYPMRWGRGWRKGLPVGAQVSGEASLAARGITRLVLGVSKEAKDQLLLPRVEQESFLLPSFPQ